MTPKRLNYLIEECFKARGKGSLEAHRAEIARFFQVTPTTLRRWLRGTTPIPRSVEVMMEAFRAFPEVTAERVELAIRERDGQRNSVE